MAVDAYRLPFDGQHVLTVVSRSSVSLNVVTGVAYQLTVLRLAVRRRAALSFLARPWLQTAYRFRFRQFVVTFDAPSLEAVAFALECSQKNQVISSAFNTVICNLDTEC